jgi:hypothetical protein
MALAFERVIGLAFDTYLLLLLDIDSPSIHVHLFFALC